MANKKPWWKRLLSSFQNLWDFIFRINRKELVPEAKIKMYKNYLRELKTITRKVTSLDQPNFTSKNFLLYLKIRSNMEKNINNYEGLKPSADLLEAAIKTKNNFIGLEQIESNYRSLKQQNFYTQVANLLEQKLAREEFKLKVKEQLDLSLEEIKTEQGQKPLNNYFKQLEILSENDLGLTLLILSKKYTMGEILSKISDIMETLTQETLTDLNIITTTITQDYEVFEKLAPIIGLVDDKASPETFALILQYLTLENRYKDSYEKYQNLITALKKWKKTYYSLITLRGQYSSEKYKLPEEFKEKLPGEELYNKYQAYL